MQKAIRKSEKAADRLDTAKANIPKQKRIKAARRFDEATGRAKTRLYFEERDKPPNGKFKHNPAERPIRGSDLFHTRQSTRGRKKDNSGVEGAHKTELLAERAAGTARRKIREGIRSHKPKPYRKLEKRKRKPKGRYKLPVPKDPQRTPGYCRQLLSHFYQKQKIKLQYAKGLTGKTENRWCSRKTAKAAKRRQRKPLIVQRILTDFL